MRCRIRYDIVPGDWAKAYVTCTGCPGLTGNYFLNCMREELVGCACDVARTAKTGHAPTAEPPTA
jgi:hypothetical protein